MKRIFAVLVALALVLTLAGCGKTPVPEQTEPAAATSVSEVTETEPTGTESAETEPMAESLSFPYEVEGLTVSSCFPSSVENPDFENRLAEDIATLEVTNTSDRFLERAELLVTLTDGRCIPFEITNLPAGMTAWAFAADNSVVATEPSLAGISCETSFLPQGQLMEAQVKVTVNDLEITVENISSEKLTGLALGCHCLFDNVYFGGLTYSYPVGDLEPGGQAVISAVECYLGSPEVVWISVDQ